MSKKPQDPTHTRIGQQLALATDIPITQSAIEAFGRKMALSIHTNPNLDNLEAVVAARTYRDAANWAEKALQQVAIEQAKGLEPAERIRLGVKISLTPAKPTHSFDHHDAWLKLVEQSEAIQKQLEDKLAEIKKDQAARHLALANEVGAAIEPIVAKLEAVKAERERLEKTMVANGKTIEENGLPHIEAMAKVSGHKPAKLSLKIPK